MNIFRIKLLLIAVKTDESSENMLKMNITIDWICRDIVYA